MVGQDTSRDNAVQNGLVEGIVSRRIAPGEVLSETTLAETFGASPQLVRDALQRLERSRFVERDASRAIVVRRIGAEDIAELFEAVGEVESAIAALAALRMSAPERRRMTALVAEGHTVQGDHRHYSAINARFHATIRDGGHNAVLSTTLSDLDMLTQPWRAAQFAAHLPRRTTSGDEHAEIAEAILDRDGDAARQAMRRHIASSFFTLSGLLAEPRR